MDSQNKKSILARLRPFWIRFKLL